YVSLPALAEACTDYFRTDPLSYDWAGRAEPAERHALYSQWASVCNAFCCPWRCDGRTGVRRRRVRIADASRPSHRHVGGICDQLQGRDAEPTHDDALGGDAGGIDRGWDGYVLYWPSCLPAAGGSRDMARIQSGVRAWGRVGAVKNGSGETKVH